MENKKQCKHRKPVEEFISIQDFYYLCQSKWYWFVCSLALTMGIAIVFLLATPPVYTHSAELLIKEEGKGNSLPGVMDQTFSDMGLFKVNTNVNNEILSISSSDNLYEVVKRLNLDVNYYVDSYFRKQVAYGQTLPMKVSFLDIKEDTFCNFTLYGDENGGLLLSDWAIGEEEDVEVKGALNDTLSTPVGRIVVTPTIHYMAKPWKLYINRTPFHVVARSYLSMLDVRLSEENASVITLKINDVCPQRANDVLNTVISVYKENWIKDKNQIAVSTSMFINERLNVIERELGYVDQNISSFKSEHLLSDVQSASSLYMAQNSQTTAKILALNNQLYMSNYVRHYLADTTNKNQLLPTNSGIESVNIEQQIADYNRQLLQRNELVSSSSEKNPLVVDLDMALASIRSAIITSIDNQITTLNEQIRTLQQTEKLTTSKLAENPNQAKYLLSVERQQKVKEALYLFLLQKREENELSQAFTAYNTRVITRPNGSSVPSSPVKKNILLVAFAVGIFVPALIVFLKENMNTKVRGRKDLDWLTIPFIGEIPQVSRGKRGVLRKKPVDVKAIVVKEGCRNIVNEAFRVLRTNLEFIIGEDQHTNVIVVTSFVQGSGKSFLSMNVAVSLAIKKKKVLVIDGDMRHASTSAYLNSPKKGLSLYLSGKIADYKELIVQDTNYESLYILPVGIIPPNPTELLNEDRLSVLIREAKQSYDYVLIDCPPIELVADTQILEKLSDRTIFVVRAGLLDRSMLSDLQHLYEEDRYKNMSLVLNGTEESGHNYYGYKYGYLHGYGLYYHQNDNNKIDVEGWKMDD